VSSRPRHPGPDSPVRAAVPLAAGTLLGGAPGAPEPLLELVDVHKHYRSVRALDGVSLSIAPGETLGMVGESGCGKSTVARLVVALERPTSGRLCFRGEPYPRSTRALRAIRRRVGVVFQDPYDSLDPRFTVGQIVDEPLRAHRLPRGEERVRELLADAGMRDAELDSYPAQYSGGQRQRIGIARALALEPELLVLDEPTSALDVSVQAQILNLLLELQRRRRIAYLFISHDLEVVRRMSDRVAVIYAGRIVELGPAASITASPRHPYTRALIDAIPAPTPAHRQVGMDRPAEDEGAAIRAPRAIDTAGGARASGMAGAGRAARPACPYAPRCPRRTEICAAAEPQLRPADGRLVACHHPLAGAGEGPASQAPRPLALS